MGGAGGFVLAASLKHRCLQEVRLVLVSYNESFTVRRRAAQGCGPRRALTQQLSSATCSEAVEAHLNVTNASTCIGCPSNTHSLMASALDEIAMSANVFRVLDFAASLSSSSSESKPKSRVSHPRGRWGVNSQPEHVEYIRTVCSCHDRI